MLRVVKQGLSLRFSHVTVGRRLPDCKLFPDARQVM
jgi:hypothetical protein